MIPISMMKKNDTILKIRKCSSMFESGIVSTLNIICFQESVKEF